MKLFAATKAFVVNKNKVLILQESTKYTEGTNAGRFDVPGGRVKPGERFNEGLRREVQEETGLKIKIGKPFFVNEWRPIVNGEKWQIIASFFECKSTANKVKLSKDHADFKWIKPKDYKKYNLIPNLDVAFKAYLKK